MTAETSNARGEWVLVPREIVDRFPEINPSNYDHGDACVLNAWGVELVLAVRDATPPPPADACPNCDDTGDVTGADGEWRGVCTCPAGQPPADAEVQYSPQAGEPPIWFDEWFIAQTQGGERVVLRRLPKEWAYDYTTADGTYFKADRIRWWMQFPDSQFKPLEAALSQQPEPKPEARGVVDEAMVERAYRAWRKAAVAREGNKPAIRAALTAALTEARNG